MKTTVTFRHTKGHHPNLHDKAIETSENFEKYFEDIVSSNFEFDNQNDKAVKISVHVQGHTLVAEDSTDDFQKSLHEASDKIIRQLRKLKTKLKH